VRFHAAEWHIDPHKIGVLDFRRAASGGRISTHFKKRLYTSVDAADKEKLPTGFCGGSLSRASVD